MAAIVPDVIFRAQGNSIFEVGTGVLPITALVESTVGVFDETTAPGVCSDKSCAYHGWNSPGPNWRMSKFAINAPDPVLIMETWCSEGMRGENQALLAGRSSGNLAIKQSACELADNRSRPPARRSALSAAHPAGS
jgi:hypothetical protein